MISKMKNVISNCFIKASIFDKALFVLMLIGIFYIFKTQHAPIHDYGNYYFGGKIMWNQNFDSQIYFPEWFNKQIVSLSRQTYYLTYTPNTPFLALVYLPFSFMEIGLSKLIFNLIFLILFGISLYRLFRFLNIDSRYLAILPLFFLIPIKNNILFGQSYFLVIVLLIEAYIALEKNKSYKAGFLLSLAICLKVFPVFLIPYFLIKKDWKTLFSIALFSAFFIGITLFFVPFETWEFYFLSVMKKVSKGEISGEMVSNYQSSHMFLKSCLTHYQSWLFGWKIALLSFVLIFTLKSNNNLYNYTAWLMLSIAFSAYGSTYSLLLLIWFYVSICKSKVDFKWKFFGMFLLFLICNIPIHYFEKIIFPFNYIRLLMLLILGAGLLYYVRKQVPVFGVLLVSALFSVFHLLFFTEEKVSYAKAIPNETELLITDFQLKNNRLSYNYWTQNGPVSKGIDYPINSLEVLEIKENQIYFNHKKITNEISFKKKAILVNDSHVLFLSDYDRGLGFYDLKKIKLEKIK